MSMMTTRLMNTLVTENCSMEAPPSACRGHEAGMKISVLTLVVKGWEGLPCLWLG